MAPGTTQSFAAPGLLVNDDPLPNGLHLHFQTTLASVSYVHYAGIADDGSFSLTAEPTAPVTTLDLAYCMGPSATEGSACTSNWPHRLTPPQPRATWWPAPARTWTSWACNT